VMSLVLISEKKKKLLITLSRSDMHRDHRFHIGYNNLNMIRGQSKKYFYNVHISIYWMSLSGPGCWTEG
jgi:hypothetical protein